MPRRSRSNGEETPAPKRAVIGDNVSKGALLHHFSEITRLESEVAAARQELGQAWKDAEAAGINKRVAKKVFKLASEDPATIDLYVRSFTHYTTQLGLFDRIDEWKQAEAHEANAASVDAAERELAQ